MGAGDVSQTQGTQNTGGGFEQTGVSKIFKSVEEVQFTDSSVGADSVSWDFGDGNNSTERNPLHQYFENGEYVVTLIAINEFGQSTETQTIIVEGIGIEFYEVDEEETETEGEVEETEEEETEGEGRPPVEETTVTLRGRLYQFGMNQSEGLTITNLNYPTLISEIEASRQLNVENQGSYFITSVNESRLNLATIVQGMTMGSFVNFTITVLTTQTIDNLEEKTYDDSTDNNTTTTDDDSTDNSTTTDDSDSTDTDDMQVYGCTDSTALNYNPKATIDDGSCEFSSYGGKSGP